MKKIIMTLALAGIANVALADNDVGCGWGTQIWKGESGVAPKILASTTNGVLGNQTFGITFGTAGCSKNGVITAQAQRVNFVALNGENLARDMAVGKGETLDAFAALMGVSAKDKDAFFSTTKTHFSTIYAPSNQTAGEVLSAVNTVMRQDTVLHNYAM